MTTKIFPETDWECIRPAEAGFNATRLDQAKQWLNDHLGDNPYRFVIVRSGRLVVEWNQGLNREERFGIASAAKSILSSMLGIAIEEGKIASVKAKIATYYPEAMDVSEGEGPKDGRYVFAKDHDITFRQLISNTSGYMKPGEAPGQLFHYQTFGMNITGHAIAKTYGLYDANDPEGSPNLAPLYQDKIASPIGVNWSYPKRNFNLHAQARLHIFGYATGLESNALDLARLGWLWCNWGRWQDKQIIPETWLREATQTAPDVRANCSPEQWKYGYAFWVNDHGQLWPNLPRSGFTASGAGGHYITVFPDQELVIVQNPGHYTKDEFGNQAAANPELLKIVLAALE